MYALYHSDKEYRQHSLAIHALADQYHLTEAEIRKIYEEVLKDLQTKARFKNFLSVLVTRHVKEVLHRTVFISKK